MRRLPVLVVLASASVLFITGCEREPASASASSTPRVSPAPARAAAPAPVESARATGFESPQAFVDAINATAGGTAGDALAVFEQAFIAEDELAQRMLTATLDMMRTMFRVETAVRQHLGADAARELMADGGAGAPGFSMTTPSARLVATEGNLATVVDDETGEEMAMVRRDGRWFVNADAMVEENREGAAFAVGMLEAMSKGMTTMMAGVLADLEAGTITSLDELKTRFGSAAMDGSADEMFSSIGESLADSMAEGLKEAFEGGFEGFEENGSGRMDLDVEPGPLAPFVQRLLAATPGTITFDDGTVVHVDAATVEPAALAEAEEMGTDPMVPLTLTVRTAAPGKAAGEPQTWDLYVNLTWYEEGDEFFRRTAGWNRSGLSWGFGPKGMPEGLDSITVVSEWMDGVVAGVNTDGD